MGIHISKNFMHDLGGLIYNIAIGALFIAAAIFILVFLYKVLFYKIGIKDLYSGIIGSIIGTIAIIVCYASECYILMWICIVISAVILYIWLIKPYIIIPLITFIWKKIKRRK